MVLPCLASVPFGTQFSYTVTFRRTDNGDLVDPSEVQFRVKRPDGTVETYPDGDSSISQESLGVWSFLYPGVTDEAGEWVVRGEAPANDASGTELKFDVPASEFPALP